MSRSLDPYLLVHTLAISLLLSPNPSNLFLSFRKDATEGEAGDDDVHVSCWSWLQPVASLALYRNSQDLRSSFVW